eukprot:1672015-Lingulodinium_polyedra.AAC.1
MEAGIKLLSQCPWGTTVAEQQHASVSLIHRHHPDYYLNTLMIRAGLHSMRRLLPKASDAEMQ